MSKEKLETLWYTRCPVPTGLGIALQNGWLEESFASQCVNVQSLRESNDKAVRDSHFDHKLSNSVRHGGSIPAIWAKAIGRDTRLLGLSWADEVQLILTLPGSGIRTARDLKGRRFGLPRHENVLIDFQRAQAIRSLENALKLDGLSVSDVQLVDLVTDGSANDGPARRVANTNVFSARGAGRNPEITALIRGDVDAVFLKGAHGAHFAQAFGLVTVIDTGSHPEPLIRSNNGTPRTLTVDRNLAEQHFGASTNIVQQVLRAEAWAWAHPDETRRFLARESNTSEFWVTQAYGENAHKRLKTDLDEVSINALQDFTNFLARWEFLPASFDVRAWIDSRPYEAALSAESVKAA